MDAGEAGADYVAFGAFYPTLTKASEHRPAVMYVNDFDDNGSVEQVIACYNGDVSYPLAMRDELLPRYNREQMPVLPVQPTPTPSPSPTPRK